MTNKDYPSFLQKIVSTQRDDVRIVTAKELEESGVLFVQDGNHGNNRPRKDEFVEDGIPFIRPPDLQNGRVIFTDVDQVNEIAFKRIRKGIAQPKDILLTTNATIGRIALAGTLAPEVFVVNPQITIWRTNEESLLDHRYLYYFMKDRAFMGQLWSLCGDNSTFNYVNLTLQKGMYLAIPPIGRQKTIAHILGTLDEKIELNQKMNQTLEEIAKAIFKSWFVDFDPVRAKAEGRPTGLPPEISVLFPDELVDSEIGEIPKGWSQSTFGELADIQNGYAFKSKDWNEEGTIPVVKIGNVKPMLVDVDSCSRVDSQTVAGLERFRLSSGDALIGMTGYVGEVGLVPKVNELPYLNQRVGRLIAQAPSDYSFMVVMTRRKEFKVEVENLGTGSAQANVSASSIKSIKVVAPSSDLKEKFGEVINPIIDRILTAAGEIEVLSELRDTLLPKLISGELRIPDAEKFLEEVGI
ncbi:restriction endonuclease subunit S [Luminiphilus sp.]|nr:restriction endonuclease subunit S [Luminiphilus sp.]